MTALQIQNSQSKSQQDIEEYVLDFLEQMARLSTSAGLIELATDIDIVRQAQLARAA
ncbi:hypothetical protein ACJ3XI_06785 [Litorimonas sp. RW-G-Af-16]|uniref:hypothetical protein n=1 Tax=Litorimonas sp. RW-G-Af-16 TaxID=3241168 RepID=UPI00390C5284